MKPRRSSGEACCALHSDVLLTVFAMCEHVLSKQWHYRKLEQRAKAVQREVDWSNLGVGKTRSRSAADPQIPGLTTEGSTSQPLGVPAPTTPS